MAFNIGLSGLRAATSDLNVTGNNIANAGTAGFKQSRAEFSDVYAASVLGSGKNAQGSGVLVNNISQLFNQGSINTTQNSLDLAINGNGFFQTSNNGEISYTRAGYFGTDSEGFMVNNFGYKLQGFAVDGNGNLQNGVVNNLRIETASQEPRTTTTLNQTFNLNSTNTVPTDWQGAYDIFLAANPGDVDGAKAAGNATFNPADPTTYNSSTSTNVYDTQGNAHVLTQYFVKSAPNEWQMNVLIDGRNPGTPEADAPAGVEPVRFQLAFNASGEVSGLSSVNNAGVQTPITPAGQFTLSGWNPAAPDASTVSGWSRNGASGSVDGIAVDLRGSSQFSSSFAVNSVSQDGYTTGQLAGLEIDDGGVIFARYTNGQSNIQGQVILASFGNVQGLAPVGKTSWVQSFASGEPVIGTPGSGTLGALQSGALEDSNVELSDQLVNLIVAQRNYQANAKTIETESSITQTIINLR